MQKLKIPRDLSHVFVDKYKREGKSGECNLTRKKRGIGEKGE
jgi:hypothetical protein